MRWSVESYPRAAVERATKVQELILRGMAKKAEGLFRKVLVVERPDRGDPAIDFAGFTRAVFRGLLRQSRDGGGCR